MKKVIVAFVALGFAITTAFTGGEACKENVFFHEGVESKVGYYKILDDTVLETKIVRQIPSQIGTVTSEVTNVYTSGDSLIAILNNAYKGTYPFTKDGSEVETKLICVNGLLVIDWDAALSTRILGQDIEMISNGNKIAYKQSYSIGEKLDSITTKVETFRKRKLVATTHTVFYDRVVESYQDLTVPAGVFKCYEISYHTYETVERKGKEVGGLMKAPGRKTQEKHKSVIYYCPGVGIVRTEEYQDDKLISFTELLELSKH